jgi:MmyB-like transcription regulator ligand binding domain
VNWPRSLVQRGSSFANVTEHPHAQTNAGQPLTQLRVEKFGHGRLIVWHLTALLDGADPIADHTADLRGHGEVASRWRIVRFSVSGRLLLHVSLQYCTSSSRLRLAVPASLLGYGTLAGLQAVMNTYPWPCLLRNERTEIVAWNAPAERVAELDFGSVLPLPHQRNLMRIAIMQHFVERVVNWPEVIGLMVNMFTGNQYDFFRPDKDLLYFQAIVEDAVKVDGAHLRQRACSSVAMAVPRRQEPPPTARESLGQAALVLFDIASAD